MRKIRKPTLIIATIAILFFLRLPSWQTQYGETVEVEAGTAWVTQITMKEPGRVRISATDEGGHLLSGFWMKRSDHIKIQGDDVDDALLDRIAKQHFFEGVAEGSGECKLSRAVCFIYIQPD